MSNTIVITSIYQEFWGTEEFRKSLQKLDLPVYNAFKGTRFTGNGDVIRNIYESLLELKNTYEYGIYSDGADSYFVKSFIVPRGKVLYSAEKAMWPPRPILEYPPCDSPWKYLNGGGYCGEIPLLIEFFERYGLSTLKGDVNGQLQQAQAYLQAVKDGFPIELDTNCEYFQTTGFADMGDLMVVSRGQGKEITNMITNTYPAVFHGNGRTDMKWIYNLYK